MAYKSIHSGQQIDAGVSAALNPDVTVTPDSGALVTSGAVADALENIDQTITGNTDTTLNGILVGNGSNVGVKTLDTSSLTNDSNHVPSSGVVMSALDNVESNIGIVENGDNATQNISNGQYVIWKGSLYKANQAISSGAALSGKLAAVSGGGLNEFTTVQDDSLITISQPGGYVDITYWAVAATKDKKYVRLTIALKNNSGSPIAVGTDYIVGTLDSSIRSQRNYTAFGYSGTTICGLCVISTGEVHYRILSSALPVQYDCEISLLYTTW